MNYDACREVIEGLGGKSLDPVTVEPLVELLSKSQTVDAGTLKKLIDSLIRPHEKKYFTETTPQSLLDADVIQKEIQPWVEQVRQEYFQKIAAPFQNRKQATEWLRDHSFRTPHSVEDVVTLFLESAIDAIAPNESDEVKDQLRRYYKDTLKVGTVEDGRVIMPAILGDWQVNVHGIRDMVFLPGTPTFRLLVEVDDMAESLIVEETSLLMHVLADRDIKSPKYFVSYACSYLPSLKKFSSRHITIHFRDRLSLADFYNIYNQSKVRFGRRKSKQMNAKHLQLYRLVNERKSRLEGGVVAFWNQIMQEWNARYPEEKYTTWKGVKIAYDRLMANIDRRFTKKDGEEGERQSNQS